MRKITTLLGEELMVEEVTALIEMPINSKVVCGACRWSGVGLEVEEIGECDLNPGDPVPAGRCPECDELAYVIPA